MLKADTQISATSSASCIPEIRRGTTDSRELLKVLVESLSSDLKNNFANAVVATAYVVAMLKLQSSLSPDMASELSLFDIERRHEVLIRTHFRAARTCCHKIFAGRRNILKELWSDLSRFRNEEILVNPFLIPDLYLDLKEWYTKTIPAPSGKIQKISGSEYLRRTQFFTEDYMAEFLTSCSMTLLNLRGSEIPTLVDPACGAGNLLIAGLIQGTKRLISRGHNTHDAAEVIFQHLIGYDIDPTVAQLAEIALTLHFIQMTGSWPKKQVTILAGANSDRLGLFSDHEFSRISQLLGAGPRVIVTNPPFLGKRMMNLDLKTYINARHPEAKGDLCTAFSLRCAELLRPADILALVHQNTFWHLNSLREARERLQSVAPLRIGITLGPRAFRHLSGEKASVSLSVFSRVESKGQKLPLKYDLSSVDIAGKMATLSKLGLAFANGELKGNSKNVLPEASRGCAVPARVLRHKSQYDDWAVPMQGTSTGNNELAVKFSWEVASHEKDWVSVSKGGGYCRWWGLNRYVVLWGRNGEKIRQFPGHALRNIDVIAQSPLVYSDTGTLGLNVRLKGSEQVFIASGPGIRIVQGDEMAHLAYLNSRLASLVLKSINPKLTIAAGYIKQLPFSDGLAGHEDNSRLARICVDAKRELLSRKLSNDDCQLLSIMEMLPEGFDAYFNRELNADLGSELMKLEAEAQIEQNVQAAFHFTNRDVQSTYRRLGFPAAATQTTRRDVSISVDRLDKVLCALLSPGCLYRGRFKHGGVLGVDGVLEAASMALEIHPHQLKNFILSKTGDLSGLRVAYFEDLLHKLVLYNLGFESNRIWRPRKRLLKKLVDTIRQRHPIIEDGMSKYGRGLCLKDWVLERLPKLHDEVFCKKPFLRVEHDQIQTARAA